MPDAAELCLPVYELTADPEAGARAAHAMRSRDGALPIIEWIANAIGDQAAGTDAWLAAGTSRFRAGDARGALAAYERAVAVRRPSDTTGQLADAIGLLYYYGERSDFRAASGQAAIAYDLAQLVDRQARVVAYMHIAGLLNRIGNLSMTADLLDEMRRIVPVTDRNYGWIRHLDSIVENHRDHPALRRLALLEAHALAIRDGDRYLESATRFNLIDAAISDGNLDEAAAWLRLPVPPGEAVTEAYYRGLLAVARRDPREAVRVTESALPSATVEYWIGLLENVRGRALEQFGDSRRAEQALRRAVQAVEHARDAMDNDTFKSWHLARQREPFEDLFLLYVSAEKLADALQVVQRATARSTLDGLLVSQPVESSPAHGIAAVGAWSEVMHKLARALRASRAMATPPIDAVLARLRGNHVITYFRARGELWAIAVTADSALRSTRIGNVTEVSARVAAWRRHLDDASVAEQLGGLLLPDQLMPPPGTPLFVIEEDPIADVPIAALRRHGRLILDQHAVAYAPSAAVLSATRSSHSAIRALVLGDPTGDLPQAREEAKEVANRLKVTPWLGADAARAVVLDASEATLIHIAAHTVPTEAGAALQLADGLLDAGTVVDHGVAAGAIVLLTCSSAPITSRDELAPLASAFIAAGAHTVVASRWAVPDDVARSFARLFYGANGVADPVAAVAAAQRELVRRHVPVEQWATFALIGGLP